MSFLGDGRGHGRPYGPARRGRQLLDLCVQPPDDPLHGFATLRQIGKDVSIQSVNVLASKVPMKATVRPPTAQHFYGSWCLVLSK